MLHRAHDLLEALHRRQAESDRLSAIGMGFTRRDKRDAGELEDFLLDDALFFESFERKLLQFGFLVINSVVNALAKQSRIASDGDASTAAQFARVEPRLPLSRTRQIQDKI